MEEQTHISFEEAEARLPIGSRAIVQDGHPYKKWHGVEVVVTDRTPYKGAVVRTDDGVFVVESYIRIEPVDPQEKAHLGYDHSYEMWIEPLAQSQSHTHNLAKALGL